MTQPTDSMLNRVRALLAKAEDPAATTAEADAFTAKAAELMAKYGIEQALLADRQQSSDGPDNRIINVANPWGGEKASLLYWLADAMRCRAVHMPKANGHARVHIFGFTSDLERVELLYTSLLLQMANGVIRVKAPYGESVRAYRRSWMIGYRQEVTDRVEAAEQRAAGESVDAGGRSTDLVLADRQALVDRSLSQEYPRTSGRRASFQGSGLAAGRAAGRTANIGQSGLQGGRRAIGGGR